MKHRFFALIIIVALTAMLTLQSASAQTQLADNTNLFEPYVTYPVGSGYAVGIGDFNGDGLADAAMTTSSQLLILLQQSDGTLGAPAAYDAGSRPESLAVGDLNNDNRDDIALTNYTSNTISVFLQQADGSLASRVTYTTSSGPDAVATGDVNGDGLADVVVSHWTAGNIGVFTQNANGTLNPMVTYASVQAGYDDIAVGDVNHDGQNDVVKMNGQGLNPNLMVYLQNSNGTLADPISYSLGCNCLSHGVAIGDVTGDGLDDVVISYGGNRPASYVAVFAQNANGSLQAPVSYAAYDVPEPVKLSDLNADGLLDVASAHGGWNAVSVFPQQNNGTLGTYSLYGLPYASRYYPEGMAIGDINHDGLPDIAIADYNNGLVVLYHAPTATSMHVGDLTGTNYKGNGYWTATINITVHDANHNPLAGATVDGMWSGGDSDPTSCTTGATGLCTVVSDRIPRSEKNVTFTTTDITKNGYNYDASANHSSNPDSNGTSITIDK